MREIKFKAWSKELKKWVEPSFHPGAIKYGLIAPSASQEFSLSTGLRDKNDVEIYEGYILAYRDGEWSYDAVVTWDNETGRYYMVGIEPDDNFSFDDVDADVHEVIGNIYENPELLGAKS